MNREPVENRFKYVMIQMVEMLNKSQYNWSRSLYECIAEGNLLSLEKFRWHFLFILPLNDAY